MNNLSPKLIEKILLPFIMKDYPSVFGIKVVHRNYHNHNYYYISLGTKSPETLRPKFYEIRNYIDNLEPYILSENEEFTLVELYETTPEFAL